MRALAVLCLMLGTSPVRAETLITSLSSHRVFISSNYTGATIAIFGAIARDAQTVARATPYDIVVTARGPQQFLVVREKERLGPIWINQEQQKFPKAPAYLGVLSSRPLAEMTNPQFRSRQNVGVRAIIHGSDFTNERAGADHPFREALYRLKTREGLYFQEERGVTFLTPDMFHAGISLPATAPPGSYEVEVTLFADTVILARATTNFELVKIGFEQQMGEVARDWPAIYGLATALMALFFGWLANTIFRRD